MHGRRLNGAHLGGLALAWVAGSALQLQQLALWHAAVYVALIALALGLAAALATSRRRGRVAGLCLALAMLSFASTGWRAQERLADGLAPALEGLDLQVVGTVGGLPRTGQVGTRFEFEVEQAYDLAHDPTDQDGRSVTLPRRLSLAWWRHDAQAAPPAIVPRAGERWSFTLRLRQPHGVLNPYGFDYELWLFERGLRATGYVREQPPAQRLQRAPRVSIDGGRQSARDAIARAVADDRAAGVLAALTVGDQAAIERADWDLFRRTGIAHLMSISGLHVTMFAWLAALLVGALWRRSASLSLRLPAPQAARWGGLLLAFGYALMAGWGVPAQRTLAMLAVVVCLRSLGWRWPGPLVLAAAAAAVTVLDPWALLQPGFWLSFSAVGLLMVAQPGQGLAQDGAGWRARVAAALRSGLHTQAVATAGLAPLSLLFFQQVSVVGFVANLIAIPLVTLLVTPLALLGLAWAPLWQAAAALVQGLSTVLQMMAEWPGAVWTAAAPPAWAAAAGLLGASLLVAPLPWRLRGCGLALIVPMLWPPLTTPAPGRFELVALDVGQGSAVLLRTRRHLLIYDTGPAYAADSDAADRVLLPLLAARGEGRIDRLLISHRDTDHVGGAARLLASWPVTDLLSSLDEEHALRSTPVPHHPCAAGQRWQWDGVGFEILHPAAVRDEAASPNALSCVLRVQDALGASVLLTGDLESPQEGALVIARAPLRSDVMMIPHHGSKTSSSAALLDAVAPQQAFVQAGYRSRYGHPAPEVLARYAERGIDVRRSDLCGAWTWNGQGAGTCARDQRRRYWHHAP